MPHARAVSRSPVHRSAGFWSAALAGLTPPVVAGVALLLLARMLSVMLDKIVVAFENGDLLGWSGLLLQGYFGLLVMAAVMLVAIVATANLGPERGLGRVAALAAAVIASSGLGVVLRIAVQDAFGFGAGWDRLYYALAYTWPRYAILGGMLTVVAEFYRREVASLRAMQDAETDRASFEREMVEARLQVLQAQIEPHFLFNTLANVRQLYERDVAAGRTMLQNLMRYLEVALPRLREGESTLGRDAELILAFLRIHRVRMGRRLTFGIDVPPALSAHPVPPMMLLTLVENAIKHGLNPSPDGGVIRVNARAEGRRLLVRVADTGVGFASGSGSGTGLANLRARLAAQFGDAAGLALENNELGGVTATVALPLAGGAGPG
ncbi:MAG TPA: histidine kinase [Casimicrobiaceae bacterium]|nr:histidine kinase [Casimicrobiaceae bacterium]